MACKKNVNNPTSSSNSTSDTCESNPLINFNCIGTPVGKFEECIKDIDGNVYKTVKIGTQKWMAENLKVSKYNDGTVMPNVTDGTQWSNLTTGAWAYYNNDVANNAKYGKLYNWYTVSPTTNDNKNVCPTGWHVPADSEWNVLTEYLGGAGIIGGIMKEVGIISWEDPNMNATNSSLFTGLPAGSRGYNGSYTNIRQTGNWWSTTAGNTDFVWYRYLQFNNDLLDRSYFYKSFGFSVRCLKD